MSDDIDVGGGEPTREEQLLAGAPVNEEDAGKTIVATARPIKADEQDAITTAIRTSHTLATLEVSLTTFNEIKALFEEAGYDHVFLEDGKMIDMTGVGLVPPPTPDKVDIFINGKPYSIPYGDGNLSYQEIRDLAYPDSEYPKFPSCTWASKVSGQSGILYPGKGIMLENGLNITIVDTSNA